MQDSTWSPRIKNANDYYNKWKNLFQCEMLEKYYENFQWNINTPLYKPYTLNLIFSTIQIKLANIFYSRPQYIVDPQPGKMDWNQEFAVRGAQIKGDALNTIIKNPKVNFKINTKNTLLDSYFRFGITRVGYSADWENPNKVPYIKTQDENNKDIASLEIPVDERVYFNHIKASRWRVSTSDDPILGNCAWYGYYSWMYKSNLQKIPGVDLPTEYKSKYYAADFGDISSYTGIGNNTPNFYKHLGQGLLCKVWHIWDVYNANQLLLLDDHNCYPVWEKPFDRSSFSEIRWIFRAPSREDDASTSWYPIPPVWYWLSPQDEVNQAKEQMRNYRKRFTRKWWYLKGQIEPSELDKLKSNVDGEMLEMKRTDAIGAISNPEIGISIEASLTESKTDMNLITGTPATSRAQADRQTATATKLADVKEQIRESAEQMDFTDYLISLGREALITIKEHFTSGMWIKTSLDAGEEMGTELQVGLPNFQYITVQDLDDGYDEEITVNVINATPAAMIEEEAKFVKFVQFALMNPVIALNPKLIRECAYRFGYRNERIIKEVQQAAVMQLMAQASGIESVNSGGGKNTNNQRSMTQNSQPNSTEQTDQQLMQQV